MRLRHLAEMSPSVSGMRPEDAGSEISFLPLERIWSDERFDPTETVEFSGDLASYNPVAEGDILVPKVSPTFKYGRVAIAHGLANGRALATSEVFVIRAASSVDARFLAYRLRAKDFLGEGEAAWTGVAGLKRVSSEFVRDTWIDSFVWKSRTLVSDFLDRECERIMRLREALTDLSSTALEEHQAMIGEEASSGNDSGTPLAAINDPSRPIMYGIVLPGDPVSDGRLLVKGGNVERNKLRPDDLVRVASGVERPFARARIKAGDLLVTIRGSYGAVAEVPAALAGANITQDTARLAPAATANTRYVLHVLRSSRPKHDLRAVATGAGVRGVNIRDLKRIRIPFPQLEVQESLASRWDARQERLDQLLLEAQEAATTLAEYRDALITEAVTGKLDVTDLSDQQLDESAHAAMEGEHPEVLA